LPPFGGAAVVKPEHAVYQKNRDYLV
jgi:hypothetical protein